MNGKGDKRRPMNICYTTYDSNWDKIFGKKDNESKTDKPPKSDKESKDSGSRPS